MVYEDAPIESIVSFLNPKGVLFVLLEAVYVYVSICEVVTLFPLQTSAPMSAASCVWCFSDFFLDSYVLGYSSVIRIWVSVCVCIDM